MLRATSSPSTPKKRTEPKAFLDFGGAPIPPFDSSSASRLRMQSSDMGPEQHCEDIRKCLFPESSISDASGSLFSQDLQSSDHESALTRSREQSSTTSHASTKLQQQIMASLPPIQQQNTLFTDASTPCLPVRE